MKGDEFDLYAELRRLTRQGKAPRFGKRLRQRMQKAERQKKRFRKRGLRRISTRAKQRKAESPVSFR
jgi:hypothetical protein